MVAGRYEYQGKVAPIISLVAMPSTKDEDEDRDDDKDETQINNQLPTIDRDCQDVIVLT
eukprot:m.91593 g.91593  ORF g.91593 m.91593 type:complete len:59 (+) comp26485_c1_seq1:193-369(+)